jgi:hypothetical protein
MTAEEMKALLGDAVAGISLDPVNLTLTPPTTSGQAINYLIEAQFLVRAWTEKTAPPKAWAAGRRRERLTRWRMSMRTGFVPQQRNWSPLAFGRLDAAYNNAEAA